MLFKGFLISWIIGIFLMVDIVEKFERRILRVFWASVGIILSGSLPNGYILANLLVVFRGLERDDVLLRCVTFAIILIFLNCFAICFTLNFSMDTRDFEGENHRLIFLLFVSITLFIAMLTCDYMEVNHMNSFLIYL